MTIDGGINSYGKNIINIPKETIHESIVTDFINYFKGYNYTHHPSVGINSNIDKSVYFIGAPISVLKNYLTNETIPNNGITIQQPSLRTHNTKLLNILNKEINWGSMFTGLACLIPHQNAIQLLKQTNEFLIQILNIPIENIRIHINSSHHDLIQLLELSKNNIKCIFDEKPEHYYTHKYGMGNIVGRNFNYALKNEISGNFEDVGNFILIEDQLKTYGIELALGASTIMQKMYSLDHVLDTSIISDILTGKSIEHRKLQDSILTSILLYELGIKANSSTTKGRVFKSYIFGILYNAKHLGISLEEIQYIIDFYQKYKYHNNGASDYILSKIG